MLFEKFLCADKLFLLRKARLRKSLTNLAASLPLLWLYGRGGTFVRRKSLLGAAGAEAFAA
jgi:hypothetical protein